MMGMPMRASELDSSAARILTTLLTLAVALVGQEAFARDLDDAALADESNTEEWLAYGRTYSEQRFSPLTQIDKSNVSRCGWTGTSICLTQSASWRRRSSPTE